MTYEPPRIERRRPLTGQLIVSVSQLDTDLP